MRRIQAILFTATFATSASYLYAEESVDERTAEEIAEDLQEEQDKERARNERSVATPTKRAAIEEITVTAQKREQALFDVPMSISAFSGDALEEMGAENLTDIAAATPGFSVAEAGPGVQSIQLRGIASPFGKSTAGYQFDNVPLTSAPSTQPDVPSYDLAAVEVLRGPQGTLYGEGSMGGTVKLVSNAPDFEGFEGTTQVGFFVTKDGDPSYDIKAAFNLPVSENQAMRLVLGKTGQGGFVDQTELAIDNHNYVDKVNGRLKYLYEPTDWFNVSATYLKVDTFAGSSNAADPNYERNDKADILIDDEGDIVNVDLSFSFDALDIVIASSIFDRQVIATFDIRDGVVSAVGGSAGAVDLTDFVSANIDAIPSVFDNRNDTFANEIRLSGNPWPEFFWTAGTYYKTGDDAAILYAAAEQEGSPDAVLVDTQTYTDSEVISLFGQAEYDFASWFSVALGTRVFQEDLVTDINGVVLGNDITTLEKQKFKTTSSKVTTFIRAPDGWGITDQAMMYVTIGEGFRSGGANIFFPGSGVSPTYTPDELINYEIGSKLVFLEGLLSAEVAIYQTDWDNVQVEQSEDGSLITSIINAGDARSIGLEYNIIAKPWSFFTLIHSASFIDAEYVTNDQAKQKGDPVDFVPPTQYSFATIFNFDWTSTTQGLFRLDYNYQDVSRQQSRSTGFDFKSEEIRMVNARLGFKRGVYNFAIYGRNLKDIRSALTPADQSKQSRPRPRSIGVEMDFRF